MNLAPRLTRLLVSAFFVLWVPTMAEAQLSFSDVTDAIGLTHTHSVNADFVDPDTEQMSRWISAGVAVGDYDGDGMTDIFVVGGNDVAGGGGINRLFRQTATGYVEVAAAEGLAGANGELGAGPIFIDYDADDDLDLFIGGVNSTLPRLFMNRPGETPRFVDVFSGAFTGYDTTNTPNTWSAAFGDYDLDGDLDVYLSHSRMPRGCRVVDGELMMHMWRNSLVEGNVATVSTGSGDVITSTFENVTAETKISEFFYENVLAPHSDDCPVGDLGRVDNTFTPNFTDVDHDGYPDLLLASDSKSAHVLHNRAHETIPNRRVFANVTPEMAYANGNPVIDGLTGMGAAVADFNNDGRQDWFISHADLAGVTTSYVDLVGNRLYRNGFDPANPGPGPHPDFSGLFTNETDGTTTPCAPGVNCPEGVRNGHWGWGSCAEDFDDDGDIDIFHVNGFYSAVGDLAAPYEGTPSLLFSSDGDGTFTEVASAAGLAGPGNDNEGRGVSCFDFDRDGDMDIAVSNNRGPFKLYENALYSSSGGAAPNYLHFALAGRYPNRVGVGARITATSVATSELQLREIRAGNNFQSHSLSEAHFGLGSWNGDVDVEIEWLDQTVSQVRLREPGLQMTLFHPNRASTIDSDRDGVPDATDNCIDAANPAQTDTDGDAIGNQCDCDFDASGLCGQLDIDLLFADYLDNAMVDINQVGTDMNDDGVVNPADFAVFAAVTGGIPDLPPGAAAPDSDLDGVGDTVDNCIDAANPAQTDTDGDAIGNQCDCDFDASGLCGLLDIELLVADYGMVDINQVGTDMNDDGVVNQADIAVFVAVTGGIPDLPPGAAAPDADFDGVADAIDNCTNVSNETQLDTDFDGYGNACDCDYDNDGVCVASDVTQFLLPDSTHDGGPGVDGGTGTDMNEDGTVTEAGDLPFFLPGFTAGFPGPSAHNP